MYNVPSRTGLNILPTTCLELSKIENIVAIKEASGNLSQIVEIASLCKDNLHIYSGNDDQILPVLSLGGLGVISVLSNIIPSVVHKMTEDFFSGNIKDAIETQLNTLSLTNIMGYSVGIPRLPLVEISNAGKEKLKKTLLDYGLIQL